MHYLRSSRVQVFGHKGHTSKCRGPTSTYQNNIASTLGGLYIYVYVDVSTAAATRRRQNVNILYINQCDDKYYCFKRL